MYSLDTLPIKTLFKIIKTGDSSILGENHEEEWKRLYTEYKELDPTGDTTKVLKLTIRLETLKLKQKIVELGLDLLKFDRSDEVVAMLAKLGYKVDVDNYFESIQKQESAVKGINIKIKSLEDRFPKETDSKATIDDVIISYCVLTGLVFDTNKITVTQFYALEKAVNLKIKSLENG